LSAARSITVPQDGGSAGTRGRQSADNSLSFSLDAKPWKGWRYGWKLPIYAAVRATN